MIIIDPIKRPSRKSFAAVKDELMQEIDQKFSNLVGGAPETLDTLKELADALGNNPDILQTINDKANKSVVYTKEEIDTIIVEDEQVIAEALNQIDTRLVNLETWEEQ